MDAELAPTDFPWQKAVGIVPGARPKVCAVLCDGVYVEGEGPAVRHQRWLLCEDLARQLLPVAMKDAAKHPQESSEEVLERFQAALARKCWLSEDELGWLVNRLRVLLAW
ncbi:hypothetical protein [Paraburkholderia sp. JHI869]|uniref:hypothetical protein n=1 Tax=Paraburkholderia sp. JHI869 TaxID=3112959 RepID=UPI00317158E0